MGIVLTFDGVTSTELGITVEGFSHDIVPEKKLDTVDIPGGRTLVYDTDTYLDYEQTYTMWWRKDIDKNRLVTEWFEKKGYCTLEDDSIPFHKRYAYIIPPTEIDNRNDVLNRAEVTFHCKPFWYLKTGETPIIRKYYTLKSDDIYIINEHNYSQPIIYIHNFSSLAKMELSWGEDTFIRSSAVELTIDAERNFFSSNDGLSFSGFPAFGRGENVLRVKNVAYIEIFPRWCDIVP